MPLAARSFPAGSHAIEAEVSTHMVTQVSSSPS